MSRGKNRLIPTAFAVYVLLMIWLLFGQRIGRVYQGGYWMALKENCSLVPFRTIMEYLRIIFDPEAVMAHRVAVINLAGNIIMFVPLGFFLPLVSKRFHSAALCMLLSGLCILAVECMQLFTLLGSFDMDDLLLNMAGVCIGYGLYRIFTMLFPQMLRR